MAGSTTRNPWMQAEQVGDVMVVKLTAKNILEEEAVQQIGAQLNHLAESSAQPRILLDFSPVERLTSTMFGKLIALHKRLEKQGGRLVLCCIPDRVYDVFEVLKLHRLFHISGDEQEALQSF